LAAPTHTAEHHAPGLHCRLQQELEYGQELLQQLYLERENKSTFLQVSSHHVQVLQVRARGWARGGAGSRLRGGAWEAAGALGSAGEAALRLLPGPGTSG
jgi:hypothetical protein